MRFTYDLSPAVAHLSPVSIYCPAFCEPYPKRRTGVVGLKSATDSAKLYGAKNPAVEISLINSRKRGDPCSCVLGNTGEVC